NHCSPLLTLNVLLVIFLGGAYRCKSFLPYMLKPFSASAGNFSMTHSSGDSGGVNAREEPLDSRPVSCSSSSHCSSCSSFRETVHSRGPCPFSPAVAGNKISSRRELCWSS